MQDSPLIIGSRTFQSRLLVGTGKYKDLNETDLAIQASGAEILRYRDWETDRKSTRLNSSHITRSRMPSSA